MGVNPNKIHRKVTTFLRKLFWHKHCHHRLKGAETVQNEKKTAPTAFYRQEADWEDFSTETTGFFLGKRKNSQDRTKRY